MNFKNAFILLTGILLLLSAHAMLVQLTDWLAANCNKAYLPKPNPLFEPGGKLPFGPYIPLEQLRDSLIDN